jgi:hypothetical protein
MENVVVTQDPQKCAQRCRGQPERHRNRGPWAANAKMILRAKGHSGGVRDSQGWKFFAIRAQPTTKLLEGGVPCQMSFEGLFSTLLKLLEVSLVALIRQRSVVQVQ